MKVTDSPVSVVSSASPRVAQPSTERIEEAVQDKVSVSTPQQQAAVDGARSAIAASRSARVQEIVSAVRSGQYYPSPQQIAQRLVSEAEVEARLRAMLAK
jgi:anti-sigma28 factor (negative regulator of flagellin synthesis)